MMNKRNTEGYVLAYLLIVITVMGLIAATLMTSTLQVVTTQEKSLVYMKDKYEAMGEIERLGANVYALPQTYSVTKSSTTSAEVALANAESSARSLLESKLPVTFTLILDDSNPNLALYALNLSATKGSAKASAMIQIQLIGTYSSSTSEDYPEEGTTTYTCTYKYTIDDISFTEYSIDSVNTSAAGGAA